MHLSNLLILISELLVRIVIIFKNYKIGSRHSADMCTSSGVTTCFVLNFAAEELERFEQKLVDN